MDFEKEIKRISKKSIIFKANGEETFDRSFIPNIILYRDDVLQKLASDFKIVFKKNRGINVALNGGGGFGKSSIARYTQKKLVRVAADLGINFDTRYYNCFQYRTFGFMLREYLPLNYFISGRGYSNSELLAFLLQNLQTMNQKLLFVIDEVQNLKPDDIIRILSINEGLGTNESIKEFFSTILIARSSDWDMILSQNPNINHFIDSSITLPKYTKEQLLDIFSFRRNLALQDGVFSDENVKLIAKMSEPSGNVYYGIELMNYACKKAEYGNELPVKSEMIIEAARLVSTEFREPVLKDLKKHELVTLLAIAQNIEKKSNDNVNSTTIEEAFNEYMQICKDLNTDLELDNVRTLGQFRKYLKILNQSNLIHERVYNLETRGRRAAISLPDFPAQLVKEKILSILEPIVNITKDNFLENNKDNEIDAKSNFTLSEKKFNKAPTCFISYSWDDDFHKTWVRGFAEKLIQNQIITILDQWDLQYGMSIPDFLNQIEDVDYIIIICTPGYVKKSRNPSSGVHYEGAIIAAKILEGIDPKRLIPIYFELKVRPTFLAGRYGVVISNKNKYDSELTDIVNHIFGIPKYIKPALKS